MPINALTSDFELDDPFAPNLGLAPQVKVQETAPIAPEAPVSVSQPLSPAMPATTTAMAPAPAVELYKGVQRQSYGEAPKATSQSVSTDNVADRFKNYLATDFTADKKDLVVNKKDRFAMADGELAINLDDWSTTNAQGTAFTNMVKETGASLTKSNAKPLEINWPYGYDADNLYMKMPEELEDLDGFKMQSGFTKEEQDKYFELLSTGSFKDISGGKAGVGEYSMVWVKDPPEESFLKQVLANPLVNIALSAVGVPVYLTTGAKVAAGVDVSPLEIAMTAMAGLDKLGVTKPPVPAGASTIDPTNIAAVSGDAALDAYSAATQGTGLFGLGYNQTQNLIKAAASDNLVEGVVQAFGAPLVEKFISTLPQTDLTALAAKVGVQADDLASGLNTAIAKVAGGASLEDALKAGAIDYIREGGSLSAIIPDFIEEAAKSLEDTVREVGSFLDDEVFQNIKDIAPDLSGIEDAFREGGSALNDFVQPVIDKAQEVGPKIEDAAREVGKTLSPLEDIIKTIGKGMLTGGALATGAATQLSPTRTTDSLFGDELFKFKTQVGADMPELVKLQRRYQA